ncbi:hypothetical protein DSO57_1011159 [Entomophthora muscae]|uniref:Uncharacterized protein n=1 Tax=Entomophthora muscae TaxID=34485 RepID=A0ACC2TGZ8_9FUNG|nr:hypothetical protein DSO57_1011159 [Entomophthora muscae]
MWLTNTSGNKGLSIIPPFFPQITLRSFLKSCLPIDTANPKLGTAGWWQRIHLYTLASNQHYPGSSSEMSIIGVGFQYTWIHKRDPGSDLISDLPMSQAMGTVGHPTPKCQPGMHLLQISGCRLSNPTNRPVNSSPTPGHRIYFNPAGSTDTTSQ